ncbi:redoxin domain-containing protein|uniref:redoxin domain-containing protein n=1 Tax=Stenotrophomonas sp. SbOxS2 TaxID=2723885 RepID=UPI0015D19548|nr:redoxin domain-containing protein [Stenotrophomonas sp. SbOxS2]NYU00084.1 redoxin domain-containing protein [Stenotrophomonas sp. SbOxS2]
MSVKTIAHDDILSVGAEAPDFTLNATPDQTLSLHEFRGKPVVLVFYPADWSEVCSDELAIFNQAIPLISETGATTLGISVDSVWCHKAFIAARNLGFDLLSDFHPKGAVSTMYGAYDAEHGYCKRALFVVDAQGRIAWSYLSPVAINPGVDGVLDALESLKKS